ncbi:MAG: hypothetical protein IKA48_02095 [Fibrobacter sp.]|nr:hypothetical protein [Fibrobacter sp.]
MSYNPDFDDNEGEVAGDPQETDGVNRAEEMGPTGKENQGKFGNEDIANEINQFLMTQRFPGDICITLSMPDTYLKKAKDKVNLALWNAYKKYARTVKRTDRHGNEYEVPGFGMFDILMTLAPLVDPVKFSVILENDIKQKVAEEKGIRISDAELDYVAKHPVKLSDERKEDSDIVTCPDCHGTGEIDGEECPLCLGEGKVRRVTEDVESVEPSFDEMDINMDQLDEIMREMNNGSV